MRREFVLVLLAGAVGAGLVVLAARQAWAHAIFTPPKPLPAQDIAVTGQQLVPLASALALAALACLAAVIATRSVLRRAVGVLLAVLGAATAAAVLVSLRASAVLAAARASALSGPLGGSTTSGSPSGGAVHEIVVAGPGRLHVDHRMAVLAAPAGLADEPALDLLDRLADRLAIGDLGPADVGVDIELAHQPVDDDLEVQLAHP